MSQQGNGPLLQLPNFNDDDDDDAIPVRRATAGTPWWGRRGVIIIAVFLLIVLVGGTVFALVRRGARTATLASGQVSTGNFVLTVSATGPIQGGAYNVDFSGSGKISEIDVAVGQTVQQGQVLAKLDKTSLQDAVNAAQASVLVAETAVTDAQNSYAKTVGQSQTSVASAQTAVNNAQTSLSNTQSQSQSSIAAAQTALTNAQDNLSKVEAESAASVSSAQTALTNAQNSLAAVRVQARQQIALAYVQEQQAIAACNATPTGTPTVTPTPDCIRLAEDQYNQAVASANASVTNAENQVATAQKQLTSARVQATANNAQAQEQVTTAESQLNSAQAQANSNNANAQGQINTAQSQLNSALASSASSDTSAQEQINTAQSQLNSALVALQTAQHNLNNATLTAPHAGIVTQINGTVGGTPGVSSSSTDGGGGTFIQIVDSSVLQVVADVDEADTGNLKVGEPVLFTVSAYGNRTFRGTVSAISPNGQTVSNVVTYPVYIDVDMSDLQGVNLLPGMTANVTINVVERIGVLLIPVSAVNFARTATSAVNTSAPLITADQASVALDQARQMLNTLELQQPNISVTDNPTAAFVLEGSIGHITAKPVVLGLTDDTEYEVLAGLSSGETIIIGTQTSGRGSGSFSGFNGGSNNSGSGG